MDWRIRAACSDPKIDPAWFDANGKGVRPVAAMRVCTGCPVRRNCLNEALLVASSSDSGVWGGTTHRARREIRQNRMTIERAFRMGDALAATSLDLTPLEVYERPEEDDSVVVSEFCIDCLKPSLSGGWRCLDCYMKRATPGTPAGHGSPRSYWAHINQGEVPCEFCKRAKDRARTQAA